MSQDQPHAHCTKPYALLNFPATARLGSLLQYNPTTLLLVFKHKPWVKASQCLQLSCFHCKLQSLIKPLTLWYHLLLETGKVGEARVFAMTPGLLRSQKLSQSSQRLLWLTPVTCGFSWVSWEERSACAHTNNPPSRTDLGKSWKMLPRALFLFLPFLPIIKVKTSEFFLFFCKKKTEQSHNISCWGTLWDLADLQVQLKAGIWTGGVALQEKSRFL